MENRVYIRCDGSKEIGMGHLNRAILLAGMLEDRFGLKACVLLKKNPEGREFLAKRRVEVLEFEATSLEKEVEFLHQLSLMQSPALFILDVLEADANPIYMKGLRQFKCPIIAITDDSHRRLIDADLIVNGNPRQNDEDYSREKGRYLTGSKYFLMDGEYRNTKVAAPQGKAERILLTVGGSDHNDLIFTVLESLKDIERTISVMIVTSEATGYLDRLQRLRKELTFKSELLVDIHTLAGLWRHYDLAITAGGNTLFERIASRLPGATLCQLPRQMEIADYFASKKVNVNLGFGPEISPDELKNRIVSFLDDHVNHRVQYEQAPHYVEGRGLEYLGNEIQKVLEDKVWITKP